jgi:hypothetical protein
LGCGFAHRRIGGSVQRRYAPITGHFGDGVEPSFGDAQSIRRTHIDADTDADMDAPADGSPDVQTTRQVRQDRLNDRGSL